MNEFSIELYQAAVVDENAAQALHLISKHLEPFYEGRAVVTHHGVWYLQDVQEVAPDLPDHLRRIVLQKMITCGLQDADWERFSTIVEEVQRWGGFEFGCKVFSKSRSKIGVFIKPDELHKNAGWVVFEDDCELLLNYSDLRLPDCAVKPRPSGRGYQARTA